MKLAKSIILVCGLALLAPISMANYLTANVTMSRDDGVRSITATVEAEIIAIDLDTREVTLRLPDGESVTIRSQERYTRLEDVAVGDRVVAEYMASMEGELREPTEAERADPWAIVSTDTIPFSKGSNPAIGNAQKIRAVCTIEALDRAAGTVRFKDSRGKMHSVTGVEPVKFEGVSLGDTIVVTYTEAVALSIRHVQ